MSLQNIIDKQNIHKYGVHTKNHIFHYIMITTWKHIFFIYFFSPIMEPVLPSLHMLLHQYKAYSGRHV
jgi:hypothetical protein